MIRTPTDARDFIRANTRVCPVAGLPLSFWQADEITPIWSATEHDLEAARLAPPFWAFAWAGGQAIARWLYEHPDTVAGKHVLDLACGCGVAAIAAAQCGAKALANDIDPMCEAATLLNAELNGVVVGWLGGDLIVGAVPEVDVILAGDVFYEKPMAQAFLAFLTRCKAGGIEVIVGDPGRAYFPRTGLTLLADYAIPTTLELESMLVKQTRVWRL